MGKFNKKNSVTVKKANTPQPQKKSVLTKVQKTPKSEPQPKRKKLSQEIDEVISDEEFEATTRNVKELERLKKKSGSITPKPVSPKKTDSVDSEDESDEDFELDDLDLDSDDAIDVSDDDDSDEDSEDGDDDSEDEDSEGVEDAGIGRSKLAAKFKEIMEAEGVFDSDEAEEEDDSEEDDSEDNESCEDDEDLPPTKKKKLQSNGLTPDKGKEKQQQKQSKKKQEAQVPVKETDRAQKRKREVASNGAVSTISKEELEQDKSAKEDRDNRTLFLKLRGEVNEKRIRNLLDETSRAGVLEVRIQSKGRTKKGGKQSFAYVEFQSKEQTVAAHSQIKGKPNVFVDFVGKDSKGGEKGNKKKDPEEFDPLRLYVTGFDRKATQGQLSKVFPTAANVQLPFRKKTKKNIGYGFVHFKNIQDCRKAHNMPGLVCNGRKLVVLYAKKTSSAKKADDRPQKLEEKVAKKAIKETAKKVAAPEKKTTDMKKVTKKEKEIEVDEEDSEDEQDDSDDVEEMDNDDSEEDSEEEEESDEDSD